MEWGNGWQDKEGPDIPIYDCHPCHTWEKTPSNATGTDFCASTALNPPTSPSPRALKRIHRLIVHYPRTLKNVSSPMRISQVFPNALRKSIDILHCPNFVTPCNNCSSHSLPLEINPLLRNVCCVTHHTQRQNLL